jgi:archaemetzincin
LFALKRPPLADDWLATHGEPQQSFEQYVREGPIRPTAERRVIVLQPLGTFSREDDALVETLRAYLEAFFQLETRVAPVMALPALGKRARGEGRDAFVQFRADVLLEQVLAPRLPKDAACFLGITTSDLFPDPSWNFAFGMASLDRRVGVYSLARLQPHPPLPPEIDMASARSASLRRALMVLSHETAHMFSLPHCRHYECLMNGMNSFEELDRGTPWLCPECLRKLQWNLAFELRKRYDDLRALGSVREMPDAVDWLDRRSAQLVRGGPSIP